MRTIVTTCEKFQHLMPGFVLLAQKFLGLPFSVKLSPDGEAKSEQLRRILDAMDDDYFVLLEDDFYFINSVNVKLVEDIFRFCVSESVDRFSLQSKNVHSYKTWDITSHILDFRRVYKTNLGVQVPFSLEASVWKKSFLLEHLGENRDDGQIEMKTSDMLRETNKPTKIYALDQIVMHYRDMIRGGNTEIELKYDPLRLVVEEGKELALYPSGDADGRRELLL